MMMASERGLSRPPFFRAAAFLLDICQTYMGRRRTVGGLVQKNGDFERETKRKHVMLCEKNLEVALLRPLASS